MTDKLINAPSPNEHEDEKKRADQDGQFRKRKYLQIFFSILIAVFLWYVVINDENPTIKMTYSDIPVEYLNEQHLEEEGLSIAPSDISPTVKVVLQGKRADLLALDPSDIVATADVSGHRKGEHYVSVELHTPGLVKVASAEPSQVRIMVERLISSEKPVNVLFTGTSPANKEAVFLAVDPEEITVTGAASVVESVSSLQAVIDTADVTDQKASFNVELKPVDVLGNEVEHVTLSAERASVSVQLYSTKMVPLVVKTMGDSPDGYSVYIDAPEFIQISCKEDKIDEIIQVSTQPVDISGMTKSQDISLTPILSEGVRLSSNQEKIAATVNVYKRLSKSIEYSTSDIRLTNVPSGMTVEFEEDTFNISVYGNRDVSEVKASSFTLELDCSHLREDVFTTVKVGVTADEELNVNGITAGTAMVKAKLVSE